MTKVGVNRQPQPLAAREDDGERAGKRMRIEDVMTPNSTPENGQAEENGRRDVSSSGPSLGRISVKGNRSRYLGVGDKVVMLDHVRFPSYQSDEMRTDLSSLRMSKAIL